MNALAEVTAANTAITEYYQRIYRAAPWSVKEELESVVHLLIGTCGVGDQRVAFLCADRAVRVFAPAQLRAVGFDEVAEKVENSVAITSRETATAATKEDFWADCDRRAHVVWNACNAARAAMATDATWGASRTILAEVAANAAYNAATAATSDTSEPVDWPAAIQLFKDLCDLPREGP